MYLSSEKNTPAVHCCDLMLQAIFIALATYFRLSHFLCIFSTLFTVEKELLE